MSYLSRWCPLLFGGLWGLLGCLSVPEQPGGTQPYARLVLPQAVRLVQVDAQLIDPRLRLSDIQVAPGTHRFHFVYVGSSAQHAGQTNDPWTLDMQPGHQYILETRT